MPSIKQSVFLTAVIFFNITCYYVIAQTVVNFKNIKKINLVDKSWGLGASRLTTFEIVQENGGWKCYQTKQQYDGFYFTGRKGAANLTLLNSDKRIFVKNISDGTITALLTTIKKIKPVFKPQYIYVSKDSVINNIDYTALKKMHTAFSAKQRDKFFKLLNSGQLIDSALLFLQNDYWTDDSPYCGINIINKNNDTLKIETRQQVDYMLPWLINGVPSYDTAIGSFFIESIGDYPYSAKWRLNGSNIYRKIYEYIRRTYTDEIFARNRIEESSATNLELLKRHFEIREVKPNNNDHVLVLAPRKFSGKVIVSGIVKINELEQLDQLIRFSEDTVKAFLNSGNFLVEACKNTNGCVINFVDSYGISNKNHWFASQTDKNKLLTHYDDSKFLGISISMPGKDRDDEWLVLPDGKLLLFAYYYDNVFGLKPGLLQPTGDSTRKSIFMLFDAGGKLLIKN
jgi:hypothetical protein